MTGRFKSLIARQRGAGPGPSGSVILTQLGVLGHLDARSRALARAAAVPDWESG
jgi:hypothetical protein